jgi:hypothetical protein
VGLIAESYVVSWHYTGRWMQRYQSVLIKLRATHRDDPTVEIDVLGPQAQGFAQTYAGDGEQAKEAAVYVLSQRMWRHHRKCRLQQTRDLIVRVKVRPSPFRAERKQSSVRHLAPGIGGQSMLREAADDA